VNLRDKYMKVLYQLYIKCGFTGQVVQRSSHGRCHGFGLNGVQSSRRFLHNIPPTRTLQQQKTARPPNPTR
jgi:hypothetical protein